MQVQIKSIEESDREWVSSILEERWASTIIVTRGAVHYADRLPGYIAFIDNQRVGLVTYSLENDCEIVTLDSIVQGEGVGTALLERVQEAAASANLKRIWLITTNDNTEALRFYQKQGFVLSALYPNAIEQSRKLKPEIPTLGIDEIPLRDEIELQIDL